MSDISRIVAVVEDVRKRTYPDIPAELSETILRIEADYADDRVEASKRIMRAVEQHFAQK